MDDTGSVMSMKPVETRLITGNADLSRKRRLLPINIQGEMRVNVKGELLLLNNAASKFYVMNSTAAFIWEKLATPTSEDELASAISSNFSDASPEQARQDVNTAVKDEIGPQVDTANRGVPAQFRTLTDKQIDSYGNVILRRNDGESVSRGKPVMNTELAREPAQ